MRRSTRAATLIVTCLLAGCSADSSSSPPTTFSFSVAPDVTVAQGDSASVLLILDRDGGYTGPVDVTLAGAAGALQASSVRIGEGATRGTLTVQVPFEAPTGTFTLTLTATAPGLPAQNATVTLAVVRSGFDISLPAAVEVNRAAGPVPLFIGVARVGAFRGIVTLKVSGLPEGVSADTATVLPGGTGATLQIRADAAARLGSTDMEIAAVSTQAGSLSATVELAVVGQDTVEVEVGDDGDIVTVHVADTLVLNTQVRRSAGLPGPVRLSVEGLPEGVEAEFSPDSVMDAIGSATLTIVAASDAAPGTYTITVHGGTAVVAAISSPDTLRLEVRDDSQVGSVEVTLPGAYPRFEGEVIQAAAVVRNLHDQIIPEPGAIVWESSDPDVASVDQTGRVELLRAGNAEIRATAGGVTGTGYVSFLPNLHNTTWVANWGTSLSVSVGTLAWVQVFDTTSTLTVTYTANDPADLSQGYQREFRLRAMMPGNPLGSDVQELTGVGESGIDGNFTVFWGGCQTCPNLAGAWLIRLGAYPWQPQTGLTGLMRVQFVLGDPPYPYRDVGVVYRRQ